jgi:hypothetical protein
MQDWIEWTADAATTLRLAAESGSSALGAVGQNTAAEVQAEH